VLVVVARVVVDDVERVVVVVCFRKRTSERVVQEVLDVREAERVLVIAKMAGVVASGCCCCYCRKSDGCCLL